MAKNGNGKRVTLTQAKRIIFGVPESAGDCNLRELGKLTNDQILSEFSWFAYANARTVSEREDAVFWEHLLGLGWSCLKEHGGGGYDLSLKLTVTNVRTKKSDTYIDAPSDH